MSIASLHGEFCTAISKEVAMKLCVRIASNLSAFKETNDLWCSFNDCAPREVALRRPGKSIITAEASAWNYGKHFDPSKIESEYDRFVSALENFGVKIHWIKGDDLGNADSVFAYDASLMTPNGAILMSPERKKARRRKSARHFLSK